MDLDYKSLSFHLNKIKRGNNYILDFENTWDESLPNIIENTTSLYLNWAGTFIEDRMIIKSKIGYSWVDNYHHIENEKYHYPEFWLSINYKLYFLKDI